MKWVLVNKFSQDPFPKVLFCKSMAIKFTLIYVMVTIYQKFISILERFMGKLYSSYEQEFHHQSYL